MARIETEKTKTTRRSESGDHLYSTDMSGSKLTKHAKDRLKKRSGLSKSSMTRVADTALREGIRHRDTTGDLKRYLDGLYLKFRKDNNIRIWGDKVFMFRNNILITVLQLPPKYMRTVANIRDKKRRMSDGDVDISNRLNDSGDSRTGADKGSNQEAGS